MNLKSFSIKKLYGIKNIVLKFEDNRLILVGENGAGKTTILRILFLFLSAQWSDLAKYTFDSVSIELNDEKINLSKSEISKNISFRNKGIMRRLPPPVRNQVQRMLSHNERIDFEEVEYLSDRYGIPFHRIIDGMNSQKDLFDDDSLKNELSKKLNTLKHCTSNSQILYLPTYRRIEQELDDILTDIDMDDFKRRQRVRSHRFHESERRVYTELVEFGMNDVQKDIDQKLSDLKDFTRTKLNSLTLAYLGDVVDKKYDKVNVNEIKSVEDDTVQNILERIDPTILSQSSKKHLVETIKKVKDGATLDVHQKVICHYFSKLLNFQQELEREEQGIHRFCEVCNNYLSDKNLEYISSSFNLKFTNKKHLDKIELSYLSSGEKQIVSLFSHLYLSNNANFFVMIDEPELSLSVPWQRKFLQDISTSNLCSGFLAVTHSPFIYENILEKYAHGLGEFVKESPKNGHD